MAILLFVTATGKYIKYIPKLIEGAEKYFLPGHTKKYVVFTDSAFPPTENISIVKTLHRQWPYSTLLRCADYNLYISNNAQLQKQYSHAFAIDADVYFASQINEDILSDSVAVQHCAYVNREGEYEYNVHSACYVPQEARKHYFGGGFYGGSFDQFVSANKMMEQFILTDRTKNIIPRWHDESALNKYFSLHPPTLLLSPEYHYPEFGPNSELNPYINELWAENAAYFHQKWGLTLPLSPKIVLIDKYQGQSSGAENMRK